MHEIGVREVVQFAGLTFNVETLYMTWITMAVVILIAFLATRNLKLVPTGWQNAIEMVVTALHGQIDATMGPRGRMLAPLIISLFLFLLVSNWLGLIPTLSSPTNDLNTTLGLAIASSLLLHFYFIKNKGVGHWLKHFFEPFPVFVLMNLIEEIARPVTLAMRLFGNILAGEILLEILYFLCPWFVPMIWIAFSLFVGAVQAYIFTTLASVYMKESL